MKLRTTRSFITLIAVIGAGVAFTNAQGTVNYDVTTWSPFGKLRLQELSIMIGNNTTGIDLEEYIVKIKTNSGQIRVNEICDKNGQHCKAISSITTGSNYWRLNSTTLYTNPGNLKVNINGGLTAYSSNSKEHLRIDDNGLAFQTSGTNRLKLYSDQSTIFSPNGLQKLYIKDNEMYYQSGNINRLKIQSDGTKLISPDASRYLVVNNTGILVSGKFYNGLSVTGNDTNIYDKSGVQRLLINKDGLYYKSGSIYRLQIIGNGTKLFSPDQNKYLVINDTGLYVSGKFYNGLNVTGNNTNIYSKNGTQFLHIQDDMLYFKSGDKYRFVIKDDGTKLYSPSYASNLIVNETGVFANANTTNLQSADAGDINLYSKDNSKSLIIKNSQAITTRGSLIAYATYNKYKYSMTTDGLSVSYSADGGDSVDYSTKFQVKNNKTNVYTEMSISDGIEITKKMNSEYLPAFKIDTASNKVRTTMDGNVIINGGNLKIRSDMGSTYFRTPSNGDKIPRGDSANEFSTIRLMPTATVGGTTDIDDYITCNPSTEGTIVYYIVDSEANSTYSRRGRLKACGCYYNHENPVGDYSCEWDDLNSW